MLSTLFGKYKGTLKGDGFYWVNPFCVGFTHEYDHLDGILYVDKAIDGKVYSAEEE